MRAQLGQHMNEVVSLSIMLLMAVAIIAGQAGAAAQELVRADAESIMESTSHASFLKASTSIQTDVGRLSLYFDMLLDDAVESVTVDDISEAFNEVLDIELLTAK